MKRQGMKNNGGIKTEQFQGILEKRNGAFPCFSHSMQ
jgi:hypothetical protein